MQQHLVEISTKIKCGVLDPPDTVKMQKGNGPESSLSESFTLSSGFTCRRGGRAKVAPSNPRLSDYANLGLENEFFLFQ